MSKQVTADSPEIIHENEWVTLWYHAEAKVVHHRFHKAIRGEAFRSVLLRGTALLLERGAKKWLSDDRLVFVLPQQDQEWADAEWFPQALEAGWRFWAIAKPEKAVADLYIRRLAANRSAAGVRTELFTTPEAGMNWLRSHL
jgi:hypothetical protein